jgi:quercetin dioxygenase-like cupin family protein
MPYIKLNDLEVREIVPGYTARFLHTEEMTLAFWEVEAGAALPEHSHSHKQIAVVLEGQFELTISGEPRVLEPGTTAVIPRNAPHSGRAVTDCRLLDVFHPIRDDYR